MIQRSVFLLLALALLMWWPTGARAQTCQLQSTASPTLDFGTPPANPTTATSVSTTLRVLCYGGSQNQKVKVCVKPANGAPDNSTNPRKMANGAARLSYNIYDDAGQLVGNGGSSPGASVTVTLSNWFLTWYAYADITLTGRIVAGQSGLGAGRYTSTMANSVITYSTSTSANCNSINTEADRFTLTATALLGGSCTISTTDMDFGAHTNLNLGTPITSSATIGLNCTAGTGYTVKLGGGITNNTGARMMGKDGLLPGVIGYQLSKDSAGAQPWGDTGTQTVTGTGTGLPINIPVYGRVPSQSTPRAGSYQDVVTATVEF
jgi:spore coat protein U-like protein